MAHVADRIIAAVLVNLAQVPGVITADIKPLDLLEEEDLPALIIDDVEDEVQPGYLLGVFPVDKTHKLNFVVKVCVMATAPTCKQQLADLHELVEQALDGTDAAVKLGGLLTRGLFVSGATLITDSDSIQKPVGIWNIAVSCTYNTRSDQPGKTEKEL